RCPTSPKGTAKPIEEVAVGDQVWAWDTHVKRLVKRRVKRLFRHTRKPTLLVVVATGELQHTIEATPAHPFWVENKGWTPASELECGDVLRSLRSETQHRVISVVDAGRSPAVFNFEVEGAHNYFVGGAGVLVHNRSQLDTGDGPPSGHRAVS